MTWDVLLVVLALSAFWSFAHALNLILHQTKRSADSLVEIESTLDQISNYLGMIESDLSHVRRQVAPTPLPWESEDTDPSRG